MRIFVTGGTGVIGIRAVPLLRAEGHEVTAVGRSLNLFDREAVRRAVEGQDVVINLATHIPPSSTKVMMPGAWRENDRIRKIGSANLVDAAIAAGVKRFIQESFAPVYPDRGDQWIDESVPFEPVRYSRTVLDAEANAVRFPNSVIVRFASFYGPDSFATHDMMKFVKKGWFPLPGAPDAYVSSVSHDDAAAAVVAVLTADAGTYNVSDDEPLTHRQFADAIADAIGAAHPKLPPAWITPLFGSLGRMYARSVRISNRKLRAATGWRPRFPSAREGFAAIAAGTAARTPSSPRTESPDYSASRSRGPRLSP
jgi:nucleoside-diphosphate-sugar epimerase